MQQDVRINVDRGCLRIQFSYKVSRQYFNKKQHYKGVGKKDTPSNRKWLEGVCLKIQADLDHPDNLFDPSLEKYLGKEKVVSLPTLRDLWTSYTAWKLSTGQIHETTYITRHNGTFRRWLDPYLDFPITLGLIDKLSSELVEADNYKPNLKKLFSALIEMGNYGLSRGTLDKNYFLSLGDFNLRIPQKSKQLEELEDYRAFSLKDRNTIIKAFYESPDPYESSQCPLIEFLFLTGCRLGEAFALKWVDIRGDKIVFKHSYSSETKITKSTKTNTTRMFRINGYRQLENLIGFLSEDANRIAREGIDYERVFYWPDYQRVDRFKLNRVWHGVKSGNHFKPGVVSRLAQEGKIEHYLKPSATRHTFITLQAQSGTDLKFLADSVGNSVQTIYNHYLGTDRSITFKNL